MEFSKKTRELSIKKMQERTLDLLIIGGGITGAGVALQAAASGLETGLIEMQDSQKEHLAVQQNWFTEVFVTSNNST